jgi:hypothetical protein
MADQGMENGHDAILDGACPTCEGPLQARFTPHTVWAWCRACRRLSRPTVVPGPAGAVLVHAAAAA